MGFFRNISNFLSGPVGNNLANDPQDVRNTKKNLNRLGYFDNETENDFITRELDTGIKSFQKDNDLRVDGKLLPGGETEIKIEAQTLLAPEPYHPDWNPDGKKPPPPRKLIQMEDNSLIEAQPLNADTEEESEDSVDSNDGSEDNSTPEENGDEEEGNEDQNEKNERSTLPTVNREEIMRQLAELRQNEYQQKEDAIRILQEKQNENAGSAVGGFGQLAKNVDATGRMIRDEGIPPVPERKPSSLPIIKGIDNKILREEIKKEEDTADGGGKVTVGTGIMLPNVEAAKKLPFEIADGKGNYRKAMPEEIERAFKKVEAVKGNNHNSKSFKPGEGIKATNNNLDDLRLPQKAAEKLLEERLRSHAGELRRAIPDFDALPKGAKQGLLDLHFNLGDNKFNRNKWPGLFDAVDKRDWEKAAIESHRKEKGHAGMKKRNENTRKHFLDALEGF